MDYFQLIAAIPNYLRNRAKDNTAVNRDIIEECDISHLSQQKSTIFTKLCCRDHSAFQEHLKTNIGQKTSVRILYRGQVCFCQNK